MINLDINKILKISLIVVIGLCLIKYSSNNTVENMGEAKSYTGGFVETSSNLSTGMRPVRELAGIDSDGIDRKLVVDENSAKTYFEETTDDYNMTTIKNNFGSVYGTGETLNKNILYDERSYKGLNSLSNAQINAIKRNFPVKVLLPNVVCNDGSSPFNSNGTAKDCTLKLGEPTEIPLNFKDKPINEVDPIYIDVEPNSGGYCNEVVKCNSEKGKNSSFCIY